MAFDPNKPAGGSKESRPGAGGGGVSPSSKYSMPDLPPSPALQWFLLVAFIVSGAAYLVNQWNELTIRHTKERRNVRLHRIVQSQSEYMSHCKAGDEAFAKKRYDQAVTEYRQALQADNTPFAHGLLGQALLKEGNPDAAFAQFREALRHDSNLTNVYSVWGVALTSEDKPDEAAKVLQEGLQHIPDSGLLNYNLATALLAMRTDAEGRGRMAAAANKTQEAEAAGAEAKSLAAGALKHFTKASRNGVDTGVFWCSYGQLLNQEGKYADAESCLLRATGKDANLATAQFQLAVAADHLGKYGEAIEHYGKVLTLTPDDPSTLNNLALLYATATNDEVRTPKMAVQLATRACDATSDQNARYMDTLARSYAAAGDFFQAITCEEKALNRARQLNDTDLEREFQARDALFTDHKLD